MRWMCSIATGQPSSHQLLGEILRDGGQKEDLRAVRSAEDDHAGLHFLSNLVGHLSQDLCVDLVDSADQHLHAADVLDSVEEILRSTGDELRLDLSQALLEILLRGEELPEPFGDLVFTTLQEAGNLTQLQLSLAHERQRAFASQCLDPANPRPNGGLGPKLEEAP